ncbi:MAG: polysaccharide deacetylase family protein, partial [bacterium]
SHSRSHPNFRDLPESLRIAELVESRQEIERHLGRAPDLFGIPYGSSRDWDAECGRLALSAGYSAVFAQSENKRPEGTIGRSFVTRYDRLHHFRALLQGRFDAWEEWV